MTFWLLILCLFHTSCPLKLSLIFTSSPIQDHVCDNRNDPLSACMSVTEDQLLQSSDPQLQNPIIPSDSWNWPALGQELWQRPPWQILPPSTVAMLTCEDEAPRWPSTLLWFIYLILLKKIWKTEQEEKQLSDLFVTKSKSLNKKPHTEKWFCPHLINTGWMTNISRHLTP